MNGGSDGIYHFRVQIGSVGKYGTDDGTANR